MTVPMCLRAVPLVLLALALSPMGVARADGTTAHVVVIIKVSGALDRPNVAYLNDALDEAAGAGQTVVLQLDTAGTLDEDAVALARRVAASPVPVVSWVGPAPARASGAGLLLMYASGLAAVSPGSQTGPLYPLDLAHPDRAAPNLRSTIASWVSAAGKATDIAWRDRPLTAAEARHREIAQVTADSVPSLLTQIDGRTVHTSRGEQTLQTALATSPSDSERVVWSFEDLGPVRRVLHAMGSPSAVYLLLAMGLAALAFELFQPGFGFAGFGGIVMLALAAYGLWIVPFSWLGLLVLVAGVALMVADVWIRRLGPLTFGGLAMFVVGSALVFRGVSSQIDLSPWLIGSLAVGSVLYYGFAMTVALQARDRITSTQRGLVGLVGEARGDLAPEGPVFVKGALWRGRAAAGRIERGRRVRVRAIDGLILRVEEEPPDDVPEDIAPAPGAP
jgi:membrane-bound serine protease (ClpP class)